MPPRSCSAFELLRLGPIMVIAAPGAGVVTSHGLHTLLRKRVSRLITPKHDARSSDKQVTQSGHCAPDKGSCCAAITPVT